MRLIFIHSAVRDVPRAANEGKNDTSQKHKRKIKTWPMKCAAGILLVVVNARVRDGPALGASALRA